MGSDSQVIYFKAKIRVCEENIKKLMKEEQDKVCIIIIFSFPMQIEFIVDIKLFCYAVILFIYRFKFTYNSIFL